MLLFTPSETQRLGQWFIQQTASPEVVQICVTQD